MTSHPNSFASIYNAELAKFASLDAEKAAIFAAFNTAERTGLSYTKVRQMAELVAA
jgi:hypothetical protein